MGALPGDDVGLARALNGRGDVVGQSHAEPDDPRIVPTFHAFLWRSGDMRRLGTFGGAESVPVGINDAGAVVGVAHNAEEKRRAFLFADGVLQDLGSLGGSIAGAFAINADGRIVGVARDGDERDRAFEFDRGIMTDLNTLLPSDSPWTLNIARAVNATGHIVGAGTLSMDGVSETSADPAGTSVSEATETIEPQPRRARRAFHLIPTGDGYIVTGLDTPVDAESSSAEDINDAGDAVGTVTQVTGFLVTTRPVLWRSGERIEIGTADAAGGSAWAVNNHGQVVGTLNRIGRPSVAFIWEDGRTRDLNDALPPESGWALTEARDINDAGQIVGAGWHGDRNVAFLMTPCGVDASRPSPVNVAAPAEQDRTDAPAGDAPPGTPGVLCGVGVPGMIPLMAPAFFALRSRRSVRAHS